jgi:hypothetical protein
MSDITITVGAASEIDVTVSAATSVSVSTSTATSVSVTEKGPKGDTGATGEQGPAGDAGAGVASGGSENQFLQKNSATDYDTKWSAYTFPAADGTERQVLSTDGAGTLSFGQAVAEHVHLLIRNDEGINAGTPIYSRGEIGGSDRILVGIADASDPAKMPAIGIAETTLNTTDAKDGHGVITGVFNGNVSGFTGLSEGDILYVSNSGGGLSQTKPTGTYLIQNVGIVLKTNGTILQGLQVSCIGRTNDVPNIPNGQAWIGNASGVATPTTLATVATTGAYSDLSGTPTIPSGNLVDDTTPQLGGDLDVNGNKITSASNGDITIDPDGTGAIIMKSDDIQFDGGGTFGGKIKLYESDIAGSNFIAISAPLFVTSDTTLTLPDGAGSVGQALTTNGFGTLSWTTLLGPDSPTINGLLTIEEGGADTGRIALYDVDGTNYVIIKAPSAIASNFTLTLPDNDGASGQALKTDGSGVLSWGTVVDTTGTPGSNQICVFSDADTIEGDSNFKWDGNKLTVSGELNADRINAVAKNALSSAGNYAAGSEILGTVYSSSALTGDAGEIHYLGSSTSVAANATTEAGGSGMLVVVTDAEDRAELLARGVVRVSTTLTSASIGDIVYLNTTDGTVTTTAPTGSGNVVRIVGHVVKPSANMIYFNPSSDWIVVA